MSWNWASDTSYYVNSQLYWLSRGFTIFVFLTLHKEVEHFFCFVLFLFSPWRHNCKGLLYAGVHFLDIFFCFKWFWLSPYTLLIFFLTLPWHILWCQYSNFQAALQSTLLLFCAIFTVSFRWCSSLFSTASFIAPEWHLIDFHCKHYLCCFVLVFYFS